MTSPQPPAKALRIALWVAQALLALTLLPTGVLKLALPIPTLAALWPWAGEHPALVRATGGADVLGGLGLLLPALTRIRPALTVPAALGCALLQVCAIGFHLARGEAANTPFNGFVLALALFVAWGRWTKAPLAARG